MKVGRGNHIYIYIYGSFFISYETLGKFHTYETRYETGVWNKGMKHRYETRMKHAHEISGRSKDVKQLHCGDNTFNFKAWYALILVEQNQRWQPLQQNYPQNKLLLGAAQIEWYETCMKQVWNLVWNFRNMFLIFFWTRRCFNPRGCFLPGNHFSICLGCDNSLPLSYPSTKNLIWGTQQ